MQSDMLWQRSAVSRCEGRTGATSARVCLRLDRSWSTRPREPWRAGRHGAADASPTYTVPVAHRRLPADSSNRIAGTAIRAQGSYYLLGGLWRLRYPRSFDRLAGPKPDAFQTDVSAALFVAVGSTLLIGAAGPQPNAIVRVLATSTGLVVAAVDLRHHRDIRALFLIEAAAELAMAAAATWPAARRDRDPPDPCG
jgi:hypothetical protein